VALPKKFTRNWPVHRSNSTLNPFEAVRFRFDVLHQTDLSRGDKADAAFMQSLGIATVRETTRRAQTHFTNRAKRKASPGAERPPRRKSATVCGASPPKAPSSSPSPKRMARYESRLRPNPTQPRARLMRRIEQMHPIHDKASLQ
jgi:hypothetical protein